MKSGAKTPIYREGSVAKAKPQPFTPGALVRLKAFPDVPPGVVLHLSGDRVRVKWSDLGYTGTHRKSTLLLVEGGK